MSSLQRSEACMTFVRPARRVLIAAASMSALFVAAACGGGGGGGAPAGGGSSSAAAADFTKQGDIEVWHGKDVSGNFAKQIKAFNDSHPNGKVTDPRAARQRRPAAPADDPEHADQEPQDGGAERRRGLDCGVRRQGLHRGAAGRSVPDYRVYSTRQSTARPTSTSCTPTRPHPTAACSTTARTCSTSTA